MKILGCLTAALLALAAPTLALAQSVDAHRVTVSGTPLDTVLTGTEKTTNKGVANGYAGLGSDGKIPFANISGAGSAASHSASDFDVSGAAAAVQALLAPVATSGSYLDLTSKPTLGTAAAGNDGTSGAVYCKLNALCVYSSPLALPGVQMTGTFNMSGAGPSGLTSHIYETGQITGTITGSGNYISPNYYALTDNTAVGSEKMWAEEFMQLAIGPLVDGNANVHQLKLLLNSTPAAPGTYVTEQSEASASVPDSLTATGGAAFSDYAGSLFSGNDNTFTSSGATNLLAVNGREIDCQLAAGSSAASKRCLAIVLGNNDGARGTIEDVAIIIGAQSNTTPGWGTILGFGSIRSIWPGSPTSDLIGAMERRYSNTDPAALLPAHNGVHLNEVGFTGNAYDSPGFAVDGNANVNASAINAPHGITMQTASVAGVNIAALGGVTGGEYQTPPTLFFGPPPTGGVQATGIINYMVLTKGEETTAGFACSNGDTFQVVSGSGTSAVIALIVPTPGAGVTGYTIVSVGAYSNPNSTTTTMTPVSSTCTSPPGFTWYFGLTAAGIQMTNNGLGYSPNPAPAVWTIGGGGQAGAILTAYMGSLTTSPFSVDASGNVTAASLKGPLNAANFSAALAALPSCTSGATTAPVPTGSPFQCGGLVLIAQ